MPRPAQSSTQWQGTRNAHAMSPLWGTRKQGKQNKTESQHTNYKSNQITIERKMPIQMKRQMKLNTNKHTLKQPKTQTRTAKLNVTKCQSIHKLKHPQNTNHETQTTTNSSNQTHVHSLC